MPIQPANERQVKQYGTLSKPTLIESHLHVIFDSIACGNNHCLSLDITGTVWSWGEGNLGQLGHGVLNNERYPRAIIDLEGLIVEKLAAGAQHSVALLNTGEAVVWGRNNSGQLGTRDKTNLSVP